VTTDRNFYDRYCSTGFLPIRRAPDDPAARSCRQPDRNRSAHGIRGDRGVVKGQAIWLSAAKEFQTGRNRDSIMAIAGWMQTTSQDRASLELLGHLHASAGGHP
jgi:hypothetical protein